MSWFYRYETKGIQSWILDSNLMRDLAGGSALVESLTALAAERAEKLPGTTILQSTSGAMTALFTSRDCLEQFASTWPLIVSLRAPGLQLVQAWVEQKGGSFKELFRRLAERRNRVDVTDIEAGPWVLRAGRSGLPALPRPREFENRKARMTALDATAIAKERAREAFRKATGPVTGGRPWSDFDEESDRWDGPVAVVHADGSGVGQRLIQMGDDPEALRNFSKALRDATTEATRRAIDRLPHDRGTIQARPIVSAGDDLTCLLPARHARMFAEEWLGAFEEETDRRSDQLKGKLFAGAGVAIVHAGFPFARANKIAESLCKEAKKAVEKRCSVIAFRRVTTSLVENDVLGSIAWRVDPQGRLSRLTGLVDAVADLPRGTLRTWLGLFERQDVCARQYWRRAAEVAEGGSWNDFLAALRGVGADCATGKLTGKEVAVALGTNGHPVTPIKDALTLSRLEKKGGR